MVKALNLVSNVVSIEIIIQWTLEEFWLKSIESRLAALEE